MSVDWLRPYFYLEGDLPACRTKRAVASGDDGNCSTRISSKATVSLEFAQVCEAAEKNCFGTDGLAPGEEEVIERPGSEDEHEPAFTGINGFRSAVKAWRRWFA